MRTASVQRGLFIAAVRALRAQGLSFTPHQGPRQIHCSLYLLSSSGAGPLRAPVFQLEILVIF